MSSLKAKVSRSYHSLPPDEVDDFALGVKDGYYGNNPPFTVLPITAAAFQALIDDYIIKRAAFVNGGESQKGAYLLALAALMSALDSLADETDEVADGDVPTIEL